MAERVAGEVQNLDPPVVPEPDRLAASQSLVDRSVAAAHSLQFRPPFLVGLVEAVGLVPQVVLRHHRVVRLDPAAIELVAARNARRGADRGARGCPRVIEIGVADQDLVDGLEPESPRFQIRLQHRVRRERHAGVEQQRAGVTRRARTGP